MLVLLHALHALIDYYQAYAASATFAIIALSLLVFQFHLLFQVVSNHSCCRQCRRPTAYPGGPRSQRGEFRAPSWPSQRTQKTRLLLEKGWRYVEGAPSHDATAQRFNNIINKDVRLTGETAGRQTWQFDSTIATDDNNNDNDNNDDDNNNDDDACLFDAATNPNSSDLIYRRQQLQRRSTPSNVSSLSISKKDTKKRNTSTKKKDTKKINQKKTKEQIAAGKAAYLGTSFYSQLQCDDGHWGGDYGGPMFLMPGIVIVAYVTKTMNDLLPPPHRRAMILYLRNHQQKDGGWGTHIESPSTMFGSTLSYITMRLLGVSSDDVALVQARVFMHSHGGALYTSSWAKFWLSVLGVYEYVFFLFDFLQIDCLLLVTIKIFFFF